MPRAFLSPELATSPLPHPDLEPDAPAPAPADPSDPASRVEGDVDDAPSSDVVERYYRLWYLPGTGDAIETIVRHRGAPLRIEDIDRMRDLSMLLHDKGVPNAGIVALIETQRWYVDRWWHRVLGRAGEPRFESDPEPLPPIRSDAS